MKRFERQIALQNFGIEKQNLLSKSRVLLIGAGGLGCPILLYLAAMGVGSIGIVDGDIISESNLNRQIIFGQQDVGLCKSDVANVHLSQKYNDIQIDAYPVFIDTSNAIALISNYDIIVDGTDNFIARYLINDACVLLNKPLVFGAIYGNEGQVAVFNVEYNGSKTNYRDIFPEQPSSDSIPNCNHNGVLGVLPGIIGTMMATEVVKIITNFSAPLFNQLLQYHLATHQTSIFQIMPNRMAPQYLPKTVAEFVDMNYSLPCMQDDVEIDWTTLQAIFDENKHLIIDVRAAEEMPKLNLFPSQNIPLNLLPNHEHDVSDIATIYVFCQAGLRSKKAQQILKNKHADATIISIKGGINSLTN